MAEYLHIVCPHCAAANRVPAGKPAGSANCGACHRALFEGRPVAVDATGFAKHVKGNDIAVLVDVWAPWCGPCRVMAPMFEAAAAELEPQARLLKLNADEAPQVAAQFNVSGIPALLLLRAGRLLARQAGVMDARHIVSWARGALAPA